MQQMLRLAALLICLPALAWADSNVSSLPAAASPLPDGSCLYVDMGPGTDSKLCTNYGATLGILNGAPNTVRGNLTGATANETANPVPSCSDTGGNHLNYTTGAPGAFTCGTSIPSFTVMQATPADPTGTASTTAVMMGLGSAVSYKPVLTGKTVVTFSATAGNSATGGGSVVTVKYGTGAAPANGAAVTGTTAGVAVAANINSIPGRLSAPVTGYVVLTPNTTYWFDAALNSQTTGTSSLNNCIFVLEEVP